MNRFIVTGNLTKDAEIKYTQNEKAYSKFSIANNEGFGDNKKTNFFNCTLWGKSAENLNKYLLKGQKVLITGEVSLYKYNDNDGVERQGIDIVVDTFKGVELIGNKATENNEINSTGSNAYEGIEPVDDSEMPF